MRVPAPPWPVVYGEPDGHPAAVIPPAARRAPIESNSRPEEADPQPMKPPPFVYHAPRSVEETVQLLADVGADGKILAGGQSLIPILNFRLASPDHLIDINQVSGWDEVEVTPDHVRIGARVRHAELERHEGAASALPLLRQALRNVAHPAIRNRGTTVGSIAHADAAGEMPAVAVLTGAVIEADGPNGVREIPAREFFVGPLETTLSHHEVVSHIRFPRFAPDTRTAFRESARRSGDYATAGVAVAVRITGGVVAAASAAFVSVTDIPCVLDLTPALGGGAMAADQDWSAALEAVAGFVTPDGDIHASADYRRMLVTELTRRALTEATA